MFPLDKWEVIIIIIIIIFPALPLQLKPLLMETLKAKEEEQEKVKRLDSGGQDQRSGGEDDHSVTREERLQHTRLYTYRWFYHNTKLMSLLIESIVVYCQIFMYGEKNIRGWNTSGSYQAARDRCFSRLFVIFWCEGSQEPFSSFCLSCINTTCESRSFSEK